MNRVYQVEYERKATKALMRIPANQRALIVKKVDEYAKNPSEGRHVIKLIGRDGYRMRVGDWRVLFDKDETRLLILVLEVGSRGGIYQ